MDANSSPCNSFVMLALATRWLGEGGGGGGVAVGTVGLPAALIKCRTKHRCSMFNTLQRFCEFAMPSHLCAREETSICALFNHPGTGRCSPRLSASATPTAGRWCIRGSTARCPSGRRRAPRCALCKSFRASCRPSKVDTSPNHLRNVCHHHS